MNTAIKFFTIVMLSVFATVQAYAQDEATANKVLKGQVYKGNNLAPNVELVVNSADVLSKINLGAETLNYGGGDLDIRFKKIYGEYTQARKTLDDLLNRLQKEKNQLRKDKTLSSADLKKQYEILNQNYKYDLDNAKARTDKAEQDFDNLFTAFITDVKAQKGGAKEDQGWIQTTTDSGARFSVTVPSLGQYVVAVLSPLKSNDSKIYIFYRFFVTNESADLKIKSMEYVFKN